MPKKNSSKRSSRLRPNNQALLIAGLAVLLAGLGVFTYTQIAGNETTNLLAPSDTTTEAGDYVNLDPPTEGDRKEAEANKQKLADDNQSPQERTSDGKLKVTPVITSTQDGRIKSYVPGVIEDGGTCTAIASKDGSSSVSGTSKGSADAQYTICPPIQLSLNGNGWSVVVSYSSAKASGKTAPEAVE